METKTVLAEAYLGQEKLESAQRGFLDVPVRAAHFAGGQIWQARALEGWPRRYWQR